jgi:predicted dithiol-disulfide oxidoreductase (DUF899 family)
MNTPPIVSPRDWDAAREELLVREKELTLRPRRAGRRAPPDAEDGRADQVAHLAHLNARDTTLAFVSRAPQPDIERWKARVGWEIPWYTITDDFDADFGVDEWHGTNAFYRDGARIFRTYFHDEYKDAA